MQFINILITSILVLIGCKEATNENYKLKGGFDNNGEELSPSIWCGFTADKNKLKVGKELTIKLYFGTLLNYPEDLPNRFKHNGILPNNVLTEISMGHGIYEKDLLEKGEYTNNNPEYVFRYESIEKSVCKKLDNFTVRNYPQAGLNSKFETIVVPSDFFVKEMGSITWSVTIYGVWPEGVDRDNAVGSGATLYYRVENNNIILYDNYYNFFNDIRN